MPGQRYCLTCTTLISTVASVERSTRMSFRTAGIVKSTTDCCLLALYPFQIPPLSQIQTTQCITARRATNPMKHELFTETIYAAYTRWRWSQYAIPLIWIDPKGLCVDSATKHLKRAKYTAPICKQTTRAGWRRDEMDNLENVLAVKSFNKEILN